MHDHFERHTHASSDDHGQFCYARAKEAPGLVAVVATLSKGYDLDYIWKQVDRGPAKDAASYYIQASETGENRRAGGGVPAPGPLASSPARRSSASRTICCSASARPLMAPGWAGAPDGGRKAADLYAQLLAAEPHATAERKRELRTEAVKKARQSPLFFDLTISLSKSHLDLPRLPRGERPPGPPGRRPRRRRVLVRPGRRGRRHDLAGRARRVRLLPARGRATPAPAPTAPGCTAGRPASGTRRTWRWRTGCSTPPGTATCSCTSTPRSPTSPGRAPTGSGGPRTRSGYNEHIGAVAAIVSQHLEEALTRQVRPGMDRARRRPRLRDQGHQRRDDARCSPPAASRSPRTCAAARRGSSSGTAARRPSASSRTSRRRRTSRRATPSTARWISRRRTRAGRTSSRGPSA